MKKTTLAILTFAIFCATTNLQAEVYTVNNKFYSSKPYYYTSWSLLANSYAKYAISFLFLHTTTDDKTYLRLKLKMYDELLIDTDDYIIVTLENGKRYRLDYCTSIFHKEQPKDSKYIDFWEIEAMGEIGELRNTDIDKIIIVKYGFYYDNVIYDISSKPIFIYEYNNLMTELEKLKE